MTVDEEIPKNVKQAKDSGEWEEWKRAMDEEIECMNRHGVWDVVCRPNDKKIIGSKFVYSIKENTKRLRYKARLIAVGCAQCPYRLQSRGNLCSCRKNRIN